MKILLPRQLPDLQQLLDDLGRPSPRELARYFQVTQRTVRRWIATQNPPRAVIISLFWSSSYGLSALDAELYNSFTVYKLLSESLRRENATLALRVARLEKIGRFDSANAPDLVPVKVDRFSAS